ncbi:unnamed protein product [Rodentolepis nana]|uniref:Zinc_ribbon_2 domain-containing protein n=1 Tax=Rodentolepis nana TaxID=102285 RepID=A0A0R3TUI9_RODNA|nr:unnamed protein product [Rodentolepis nana]
MLHARIIKLCLLLSELKATPEKRQRTDSASPVSSTPHQFTRPTTSLSFARKSGGSFNRPGNRSQPSTPSSNRSQYHQRIRDSRKMPPSFGPTHQNLMSQGAGVNRSFQQQQATDNFLQQAQMMPLMGQQPQPRQEDLMSQGQHQQPWHSILGASPPQQPFGCVCPNCRLPHFQGQPYCSNCKAPLR